MKRILFCLWLVPVVFMNPIFAEKLTVFDELRKPSQLYLHQDYFYIVEFPTVYIYSLKDFHLFKQLGKQGEGPREFLKYARLHFLPEYNIIQSFNKLSYYTKEWTYLKEERVLLNFDRGLYVMGNRLLINQMAPGTDDPNQMDLTLTLYDTDFKKIKEFFRETYYIQFGKQINGIYLAETDRRSGITYSLWDNKIYIQGEDGETGNLYIYDYNGEKTGSLHLEFEKLKVTAEHKQAVEDWYKLRRRRLLSIVSARGWLAWPEYFPAIRFVTVQDDKIYVIPYKRKQGKNQLYIFDLQGKLLKQLDAPLVEETIFSFYPFRIYDGKLYQLLENPDEVWELHVHDID